MSLQKRPTLVMLAGPNGAGKSTLFETRIRPALAVPFINADDIQRDEIGTRDVAAAYDAARIAAERRAGHLAAGQSFATETVFSHPSKLDLITQAREIGYRIMMFHISVAHPDLSVARVTDRVQEGGHPVPEDKIRQRYDRNGPIIRQAVLQSDVAQVFDNSALNRPPLRILAFRDGRVTFVHDPLPDWGFALYQADLTM